MDVFLYLDNFPGESRDAGHEDWIELYSFSHNIFKDPRQVRPAHQSLVLYKRVDKASPKLDLFCNRGNTISKGIIEFTRLAEQELRFYRIQLTNVVVSSVQSSGVSSGNDFVSETVQLTYEVIQWDYTPFKGDGGPDADIIAWWNVPLNKGGTGLPPSPDNDDDGIPDDTDPDDDNDGMTDVYENANGLNRFVNDTGGDLDQDGMSNYNEFIAGTAADNAGSVFRVTRTSLESGSTQITWASVAGKNYEIYSSANLAGPYAFYSSVSSAGTGETSTLIPAAEMQKFFRIRVLP